MGGSRETQELVCRTVYNSGAVIFRLELFVKNRGERLFTYDSPYPIFANAIPSLNSCPQLTAATVIITTQHLSKTLIDDVKQALFLGGSFPVTVPIIHAHVIPG